MGKVYFIISFLDIKEKYFEVEDGPGLPLPEICEHIESEEVGDPQYTQISFLKKIKARELPKQVNLDNQNSSVMKKQNRE